MSPLVLGLPAAGFICLLFTSLMHMVDAEAAPLGVYDIY